jgi:ribose-phosphate pyrophosphokinase
VGPALLDRAEIIPNYTFVSIAFGRLSTDFGIDMSEVAVISPDAGAYKKIFKTCENVGFKGGLVLCNKVRNLSTNEIIKISFDGDVEGKNCVIIDDICDGGRTSIELGKQLKEKGASRVFLFVTHGIFSYGEEPLMGIIDHVYTTRSFRDFDGFKIVTPLEWI